MAAKGAGKALAGGKNACARMSHASQRSLYPMPASSSRCASGKLRISSSARSGPYPAKALQAIKADEHSPGPTYSAADTDRDLDRDRDRTRRRVLFVLRPDRLGGERDGYGR